MFDTIGTDIEVFGLSKTGKPSAICGKIGGTKEKPLQLKEHPKGFSIQEDNVALEYNIPACVDVRQFISYVEHMNIETDKILKKQNLTKSKECALEFSKEELSHPNALIFGCEPDYNAWKLVENKKPLSENKSLRTCGGHIHVGTQAPIIEVVKWMDLLLGIPSVILDDSPQSIKRRLLYGKAGAMRPKSYGLEYRVLSNFWTFKNSLVSWVGHQTAYAVDKALLVEPIQKSLGQRIQNCINTGDKKEALSLIKKFNINMPSK